MFRFGNDQKIFEVGCVKLGGQPGELPTVLIGSLFHKGHKIVRDRRSGVFDERRAEHLINVQDEMSERTGVPCMVDVVGETEEALVKYIDFVCEVTDVPILVNGTEASVRISASRHAVDTGLRDRVVYNSINYTIKKQESDAIKDIGIKHAIVQAFNPSNPLPQGMISILRGGSEKDGLLTEASKAGVDQQLILTPVLDVPAIGFASRGVYLSKEEFGLPTGTAPVGVVGLWKKVNDYEKSAKKICRGGAATIAQVMGADYLIYGSMAKARNLFPVCAMTDAIIAYNSRNLGTRPSVKNHPLHKIF